MPHGSVLTPPLQAEGRAEPRHRALVVIGGLPGSGKTTLLRHLLAQTGPEVARFDSEDVTVRVRRAGIRIPYRLLRPGVHCWHRWRVLRGIGGGFPVVVLTDPWTSRWWRQVVLRAARGAGRSVRVLLIDVSPELAQQGQRARGRAISERSMRRHTARWRGVLQTDACRDGVDVVIVDRLRAGRLTPAALIGPPAA
jgi:predicted kinase